MMPQPTGHHKDHWKVFGSEEGFLFRTMRIEGFPVGRQKIRREYTFFIWRDADFVSSYIDRDMKAEFKAIRAARLEREKFLVLQGEESGTSIWKCYLVYENGKLIN